MAGGNSKRGGEYRLGADLGTCWKEEKNIPERTVAPIPTAEVTGQDSD